MRKIPPPPRRFAPPRPANRTEAAGVRRLEGAQARFSKPRLTLRQERGVSRLTLGREESITWASRTAIHGFLSRNLQVVCPLRNWRGGVS